MIQTHKIMFDDGAGSLGNALKCTSNYFEHIQFILGMAKDEIHSWSCLIILPISMLHNYFAIRYNVTNSVHCKDYIQNRNL